MAENKIITVSERQVHTTKNPNVMTASISDPSSANGFSTFPVQASEVTDSKFTGKTKRLDVSLDPERTYDVSKAVKGVDGKTMYEHATKTGAEVFAMFEESRQHAMEGRFSQRAAEGKESAALKYVSESLVHDVKGHDDLKRVSFPDPASANGFGNILVKASSVGVAKNTRGEPVSGRVDIDLGNPDVKVQYSIKGADGKFVREQMTAGEVAAKYDESQKAFMSRQRTAAKGAPEAAHEVQNTSRPLPSVPEGSMELDDSEMAID